MPIMDAAYMLRDGVIALVIPENNALLTDGWVDCGEGPLVGAKLAVYRPTALGGASATLVIQSSPDAGVTAGAIVVVTPPGFPAGGVFNTAGYDDYPIIWQARYLRYVANPVVVGLGQVQIAVTPGHRGAT